GIRLVGFDWDHAYVAVQNPPASISTAYGVVKLPTAVTSERHLHFRDSASHFILDSRSFVTHQWNNITGTLLPRSTVRVVEPNTNSRSIEWPNAPMTTSCAFS